MVTIPKANERGKGGPSSYASRTCHGARRKMRKQLHPPPKRLPYGKPPQQATPMFSKEEAMQTLSSAWHEVDALEEEVEKGEHPFLLTLNPVYLTQSIHTSRS